MTFKVPSNSGHYMILRPAYPVKYTAQNFSCPVSKERSRSAFLQSDHRYWFIQVLYLHTAGGVEKPCSRQETSCLLPIWEDESIAKLTDNMQQGDGRGRRIPSEVQSTYRKPSSWAALMQICNTRRQKQDVFPGRQQWTQWVWHLFQEVLPLSKFCKKSVCLRLCKEWRKLQSSPSFCRSGRLWVWQGVSLHVFCKVHFNFSL